MGYRAERNRAGGQRTFRNLLPVLVPHDVRVQPALVERVAHLVRFQAERAVELHACVARTRTRDSLTMRGVAAGRGMGRVLEGRKVSAAEAGHV